MSHPDLAPLIRINEPSKPRRLGWVERVCLALATADLLLIAYFIFAQLIAGLKGVRP